MKTVVYLFAAATVSLVLASLAGCAVLDRILLQPVVTTNQVPVIVTNQVQSITVYTHAKT